MTIEYTSAYGPWGIVAGGSDGVGASFAHGMAQRDMIVVLDLEIGRRVTSIQIPEPGAIGHR